MELRTRKEISDYVRDHIFDYREMWDNMYEYATLNGWGNVIRYMEEVEQDACPENSIRASVILREELWKKSQKKP